MYLVSNKLDKVSKISTRVDLESRLLDAPTLEWAPKSVATEDALPTIRKKAPTTEGQIVEWMQDATASNVVIWGMCEDYNRLGSRLAAVSGDPYIPGVALDRVNVRSDTGYEVDKKGYAVVRTKRSSYRCPKEGKVTIVEPDLLAWACTFIPIGIQFTSDLLNWIDLAKTPIKDRLRFGNHRGLVNPQFVIVRSTTIPSPVLTMRLGTTSNKDQGAIIQGRSVDDYSKVLFSDKIDIPEGESEATYTVFMFPVARFCLEMQPEDETKTVLDHLSTTPP